MRVIPVAMLCVMATLSGAAAQGVDYYEFSQLERRVADMKAQIEQLRRSVAGGESQLRFDDVNSEISRLTGDIERLGHDLRALRSETERRLEDLEFRITEIEGGDPAALYQNNTDSGLQRQNADAAPAPAAAGDAPTPAAPEAKGDDLTPEQAGTVGVLGTLRTNDAAAPSAPPTEQAAFDAGLKAFRAGRYDVARNLLEGFVGAYPDGALTGEAYYYLGESYVALSDDPTAARRFLDAATLYPQSATAPQSLVSLGAALSRMGQGQVACNTLREVAQRYPSAVDAIRAADAEAVRAGCN